MTKGALKRWKREEDRQVAAAISRLIKSPGHWALLERVEVKDIGTTRPSTRRRNS